jgi:hypothetical protein
MLIQRVLSLRERMAEGQVREVFEPSRAFPHPEGEGFVANRGDRLFFNPYSRSLSWLFSSSSLRSRRFWRAIINHMKMKMIAKAIPYAAKANCKPLFMG